MTEPEKLDLRSLDIVEDKKQELLRLFPETRTEDGKIDFERLKLTLGEMVDVRKERYGVNWPGKADCFKTIQTPSLGTLRPCPEESVNFDTTENFIIEGDNLEVLKLLQKSYLGKVKMIYIDPPYNTGNDFIYPDNYTESLQTYLEYTGQVDAEGRKFGTNTEADGRFHSKWLNMMYPRLYLARNLLSEDGVILVSISDHEVAALRFLLNEVFGEENFSAQFVWKSRKYPDSRAKTGVSTDHEYIVLFTRSDRGVLRGVERDESKFANPDNDPRGLWMSRSLLGLATKAQRPNLYYPIIDPKTGRPYDPPEDTGWRYSEDRMRSLIEAGCILFPSKPDGRPREKKFRSDLQSEFVAFPSIIDDVFTADGTSQIRALFGEDVFDFPKPSKLLERLIKQGTDDDGILLDFFAGSGATAQAVLELNKSDGGHRKFILVQLPEPTNRKDFATIAEITKDRVRRVIRNMAEEKQESLSFNARESLDRGFRVFKLAESNFKTWEADQAKDAEGLMKQLELHVDHLREGRTQEDILYEILLKSGFALTTPVEKLTVAGKTVHGVAGGAMIICLERELTMELIRAMADKKPERVVCLDAGFASNDQLKANAVQIFKTKGVTSFRTV
ncbi:MAG: site-specific DNA-methyltransferase [Deltaproteobacteria bacterium]|nr:site-specific DNA-methyltransferase [Deltaproteobacteria bacterium]